MRSMSLEKRTPEGPRCGTWLPNALCIFQRTRSWAFAAVSTSVKVKAHRPRTPSFNSRFDIWCSSHVGRRGRARREPFPRRPLNAGIATAQLLGPRVLLEGRAINGVADSAVPQYVKA